MMNDDPRVKCIACNHYRAHRCHSALSAGLSMTPKRPTPIVELGSWFANLPQNCSAYKPKELK